MLGAVLDAVLDTVTTGRASLLGSTKLVVAQEEAGGERAALALDESAVVWTVDAAGPVEAEGAADGMPRTDDVLGEGVLGDGGEPRR